MRTAFLALLLVTTVSGAFAAATPSPSEPRKGWSFSDAARIPILAGGRLKPLDSYARELILFQTGSRTMRGWDPVDLLFSWIAFPDAWQDQAFIQVTREDVRKQLGLELGRTKFSAKEIFSSYLPQYAESIQAQRQKNMPGGAGAVAANATVTPAGSKSAPREDELRRVLDRAGLYRSIVSGEAFPVVPSEPPAPWRSLAGNDPEGEVVRRHFAEMLTAYRDGDQARFERFATATRSVVEGEVRGFNAGERRVVSVETTYNRFRPFLVAWILYLVSALLWIGAILSDRGTSGALSPAYRRTTMAVTWLAFAIHVGGMAARVYIAGRPPVTNMYESIIWVSFGAFVFGAILYSMHKQIICYAVACTVAAVALIAADAAPAMMDPGIHPLVPVLRSNFWLTIHVLTITLGYAAFALTLGLANVTLYHYLREGKPGTAAKIMNLNQLTYRAMQFGVVLLAAGTILGGVWADYSWGRFWGWDPKEVWALIALLTYVAILHARFTGWIGQFGFALATLASFLSVLMAWYGVNFVLGAGLHSYGFSSGGQGWVLLFTLTQLGYGGLVAAVRSRRIRLKAV